MRKDLIDYFLRQRGLYYYGPEFALEEELKQHHPHIIKQVDDLLSIIHKRLAHDAVFKDITDAQAAA